MSSLVFIDTNILLDFYRVHGRDTSLSILDHFDRNHERIITITQVEMEYKKNRQRVIIESLRSIKTPDPCGLVVSPFLQESNPKRTMQRAYKQTSEQSKRLKQRTAKLLKDPSRSDPIYRVLQRFFKAKGKHHLSRDNKIRQQIRDLAHKRFILGYPPRKDSDTSIGDAINWEWIIHCANHCGDNIMIVSRDSDYGITYEGEAILNDWLRQEFKERVSRKRSITLTTRLTEGFKQAALEVSKAEEEEEQRLFQVLRPEPAPVSFEELLKFAAEIVREQERVSASSGDGNT